MNVNIDGVQGRDRHKGYRRVVRKSGRQRGEDIGIDIKGREFCK